MIRETGVIGDSIVGSVKSGIVNLIIVAQPVALTLILLRTVTRESSVIRAFQEKHKAGAGVDPDPECH